MDPLGTRQNPRALDSTVNDSYIQEIGERSTDFGMVLYIKIRRRDGAPMGWREVWDKFSDLYPDRWAVQVFPPADCLVDEANIYHLFVLEREPRGMNICRRGA